VKRKSPPSFDELRQAAREATKRKALRSIRKAEMAAAKAGVKLSDWEGEFLGEVGQRVKTYGRAFGDPEKGAPGEALSIRQSVKLKEIAQKAAGKTKPRFGRKPGSES
jgi:hypothetical protein